MGHKAQAVRMDDESLVRNGGGVCVRLKIDPSEGVEVNKVEGYVELRLNLKPMHLDWSSIRDQMLEAGLNGHQTDMRIEVAAEAIFVESFKDILADRLIK